MQNFNSKNPFSTNVKLYTYGANTDSNHDGNISDAEAAPLLPADLPSSQYPTVFNRSKQGTLLYHLLRDVSTIKLIKDQIPYVGIVYQIELERVPTSNQINDIAVTVTSSQHPSQL